MFFSSVLLNNLKQYNNTCLIMLSSEIQTALIGRYGTSDYGKSKLSGEKSLSQAVTIAIDTINNDDNGITVPNYTDEIVSTKVGKIIQSYTRIVDKMIWRKY